MCKSLSIRRTLPLSGARLFLIVALLAVSVAGCWAQNGSLTITNLIVPSSEPGGFTTSGTVYISDVPQYPGVIVDLKSDKPMVANVPASVSVGPGGDNRGFTIGTTAVANPIVVTITATLNGSMMTRKITVLPPNL